MGLRVQVTAWLETGVSPTGVEMEGERLKSYRRWYKELDARKAELEEEGLEDPRTLKLLDGELRCLEELITLDSQLMLHLPDALGQGDPPDADSLVTR